MNNAKQKPFQLEFSNRVIEHLGIKLYQNKPTNVVAEFLSNGWDADATEVKINLKASGADGLPCVVITDNGRGMNRDELTDEFLIIGRNRRAKPDDKTIGGRSPMGRKGIGKLAGFGIAKTIDIISSPNPKKRVPTTSVEQKFFWLRFQLGDLEKTASGAGRSVYQPEVLADGVTLSKIEELIQADKHSGAYADFLEFAKSEQGGVCVYLNNTTLKKATNIDQLLQSIGRRFTVAMLRKDFVVTVNGKPVQPEYALPTLHDFGFGSWDKPIEETISVNGIQRTVKYWIKFVNLPGSDWSIEQAGIGVYAHGKIAQDRPFFFDSKGKEILSRYIYGVLEADWLDELPSDVVSTDRRSIDWDTTETQALHHWGNNKISFWLESFRKWRAQQPKTEIIKRIREVSSKTLSGTEEEALAELLNEVLPALADDEETKNRATKSFSEAWTHAPTRVLTKSLWEKIFSHMHTDSAVFAELVESLRKSLVPEAMGLAVTMAQRIAAITAMRKMIDNNKTETHLQRLIESFPWLLGPQWEKLSANQTIKTLCEEAGKLPSFSTPPLGTTSGENLKPDFVFLSDPNESSEFIVFELKGPEAGKTLLPLEYDQLSNYLKIIRSKFPDKDVVVRGVLVGADTGGFDEYDKRIDVISWSKVLLAARNLHVSYLRSLLIASNPDATDLRLQQISDFGGTETVELIKRFGAISEFPSIVNNSLNDGITEKV